MTKNIDIVDVLMELLNRVDDMPYNEQSIRNMLDNYIKEQIDLSKKEDK